MGAGSSSGWASRAGLCGRRAWRAPPRPRASRPRACCSSAGRSTLGLAPWGPCAPCRARGGASRRWPGGSSSAWTGAGRPRCRCAPGPRTCSAGLPPWLCAGPTRRGGRAPRGRRSSPRLSGGRPRWAARSAPGSLFCGCPRPPQTGWSSCRRPSWRASRKPSPRSRGRDRISFSRRRPASTCTRWTPTWPRPSSSCRQGPPRRRVCGPCRARARSRSLWTMSGRSWTAPGSRRGAHCCRRRPRTCSSGSPRLCWLRKGATWWSSSEEATFTEGASRESPCTTSPSRERRRPGRGAWGGSSSWPGWRTPGGASRSSARRPPSPLWPLYLSRTSASSSCGAAGTPRP